MSLHRHIDCQPADARCHPRRGRRGRTRAGRLCSDQAELLHEPEHVRLHAVLDELAVGEAIEAQFGDDDLPACRRGQTMARPELLAEVSERAARGSVASTWRDRGLPRGEIGPSSRAGLLVLWGGGLQPLLERGDRDPVVAVAAQPERPQLAGVDRASDRDDVTCRGRGGRPRREERPPRRHRRSTMMRVLHCLRLYFFVRSTLQLRIDRLRFAVYARARAATAPSRLPSPTRGTGRAEDRPHPGRGRRDAAARERGRCDRRRGLAAPKRAPGDRPRVLRGDPWHPTRRRPVPVVEAPRIVECGECGGEFELSARNERGHRKRGSTPTCERCRFGEQPPKPTEAMRRWWLDRYTLEQIRDLGAGLGVASASVLSG